MVSSVFLLYCTIFIKIVNLWSRTSLIFILDFSLTAQEYASFRILVTTFISMIGFHQNFGRSSLGSDGDLSDQIWDVLMIRNLHSQRNRAFGDVQPIFPKRFAGATQFSSSSVEYAFEGFKNISRNLWEEWNWPASKHLFSKNTCLL